MHKLSRIKTESELNGIRIKWNRDQMESGSNGIRSKTESKSSSNKEQIAKLPRRPQENVDRCGVFLSDIDLINCPV